MDMYTLGVLKFYFGCEFQVEDRILDIMRFG